MLCVCHCSLRLSESLVSCSLFCTWCIWSFDLSLQLAMARVWERADVGLHSEFDVLLHPLLTQKALYTSDVVQRSAASAGSSSSSSVWYISRMSDLSGSAAPFRHLVVGPEITVEASVDIANDIQLFCKRLQELLSSSVSTLAFWLDDSGTASIICKILADLPSSSPLRHLRIAFSASGGRDALLSMEDLMAALRRDSRCELVHGLVMECRSESHLYNLRETCIMELAAKSLPCFHRLQCVGFINCPNFLIMERRISMEGWRFPFVESLLDAFSSPHCKITTLSFFGTKLHPDTLQVLLSRPHILHLTRLDLRSFVPSCAQNRDSLFRRAAASCLKDQQHRSIQDYLSGHHLEHALKLELRRQSDLLRATLQDQHHSIQDLGLDLDHALELATVLKASATVQTLRLIVDCSALKDVDSIISDVLAAMPNLLKLEFDTSISRTDSCHELFHLCESVLTHCSYIRSLQISSLSLHFGFTRIPARKILEAAGHQLQTYASSTGAATGQQSSHGGLLELQISLSHPDPSPYEDEMSLSKALSSTMLCSFNYPWHNLEAKALADAILRKNRLQLGLVEQPLVPPTTAKLFLCGFGQVGKTTVRKKLITSRSLRSRVISALDSIHQAPTKGIEFHMLSFHHKGHIHHKRNLVLCDLAGQDEYHAFHHYFVAGASNLDLFMVICKHTPEMRKEDIESQLEYWFRFIISHKSDVDTDMKPRVVVVLNHFSSHRWSKAARELLELECRKTEDVLAHFSNELDFGHPIRNVFGIQATRRKSYTPALEQRLEELLNSLLDSRPPIPKICRDISEEILPSIRAQGMLMSNLDLFQIYCDRYDIKTVLAQEATFQAFKAALCVLHSTADLVYFPNQPKTPITMTTLSEAPTVQGLKERADELVITDATWFCSSAVGELLTPSGDTRLSPSSSHNIRLDPSNCDEEDVKDILRQQCCEEKYLNWVVGYLQSLEICFRLPNHGKKLIFPALLDRSEISWPKVSTSVFYGRRLRCKGDDKRMIPAAIFTRVQVRLQQYCGESSYNVGKYWASFVRDAVGGVVRFGGAGLAPTMSGSNTSTSPHGRWDKDQWIDIFIYYPDESLDRLACQIVTDIKAIIFDICKGAQHGLAGIPTVQLQEFVLSGKPSVTKLYVASLDTVYEALQGEQGIGSSFCWPDSDPLEPKRVLEVLLPSEVEEYVRHRLHMVDEIDKEFSDTDADDSGGYLATVHGGQLDTDENMSYEEQISGQLDMNTLRLCKLLQAQFEMLKVIKKDVDVVKVIVKEMKKDVNVVLERLKGVERNIVSKCSTHLVLQLLQGSLPRFPYLMIEDEAAARAADNVGWGGAGKVVLWKLKRLVNLGARAHLHLLCECSDGGPHVLKGQKGIELIWKRPELLQKVAPVLVPAVRVLCCLGKIAASVYVPGMGHAIPSPNGLFKILGIDPVALAKKQLPQVLDELVGGLQGITKEGLDLSSRQLQLNDVRTLMLELLEDRDVDMRRDFGLQLVQFQHPQLDQQSNMLWVCDEHARHGERLPRLSSRNPWRSL